MTGRLLASDLPRRQPRRVSNFCSLAGGHSFPNSSSNGPAVLTDELPPQGHPFQSPGCAGSSRQHTLDGRAPSGGVLGRPRTFLRRRADVPGNKGFRARLTGEIRIFVDGSITRENLSLTKRPEPGSFAPREVSKSLPVIGFHVPNMEVSNDRVVASEYVTERG